jgi:CrcB protein
MAAMSTTSTYLAVAAGGAIGASLRFAAGAWALRALGPGFPYGTFAVNVLGSFAMGALAGLLMERLPESVTHVRHFAMTGLLGGFTTFSAFSLDAIYLIERARWAAAAGYVGGSVALSILALAAGLALTRSVA